MTLTKVRQRLCWEKGKQRDQIFPRANVYAILGPNREGEMRILHLGSAFFCRLVGRRDERARSADRWSHLFHDFMLHGWSRVACSLGCRHPFVIVEDPLPPNQCTAMGPLTLAVLPRDPLSNRNASRRGDLLTRGGHFHPGMAFSDSPPNHPTLLEIHQTAQKTCHLFFD